MKIGSINQTRAIMEKYGFQIKKRYGQNFLVDENILRKIVSCGQITESTGVIEIGPGLGALTQIIAEKAKAVLCYEIDDKLLPILKETLADATNVTVLNQDVLTADLRADMDKHLKGCNHFIVMANLPYYITTPILLGMLEKQLPINEYVVMMQREVADRICSGVSVKDYNSLSIVVQYRALAKKVMLVPRTVFIPSPNVDSTVIRLEMFKREKKPIDEDFFFKLVRCSFAQRRKTLINNLLGSYEKERSYFEQALTCCDLALNVRSENLTVEDFIRLSDYLCKDLGING